MLRGLIQLTRPYYSATLPSAYLLTIYYARAGIMANHWLGDLISTAALSLVIASGYVLNDVFDVEVDRQCAPSRPIVSGRVSRRNAALAGVAMATAGCVLAWTFCEPIFGVALSLLAAALLVYDITSKRIGLLKIPAVAVLMASIYPLAAAQAGGFAGPRAAALPVFAVWMLLSSAAYEILKDIRDRKGDRHCGGGPAAIQRHPMRAMLWANVLLLCGGLLLAAPLWLGCRWVYALAMPILAGVPVVGFVCTRRIRWKMAWVFVEFIGLGVATTADVLLTGM